MDLLASLLDPRSKDSSSTIDYLKKIDKTAKEVIKEFLENDNVTEIIASEVDVIEDDSQDTVDSEEFNLFARSKDSCSSQKDKSHYDIEIDKFLKETISTSSPSIRIMQWWNINNKKYRNISFLANKYLPIPITSYSEEFFDIDFIADLNKLSTIDKCLRDKIAFIHFNTAFDQNK